MYTIYKYNTMNLFTGQVDYNSKKTLLIHRLMELKFVFRKKALRLAQGRHSLRFRNRRMNLESS